MNEMENIKIIAINGVAGTSKTTTLANIISKLIGKAKYIGLAFTHHAVHNLYKAASRQSKNNAKRSRFKTIHSFFRVNPENDMFLGMQGSVEYVIIDEFSMISKDLMQRIINDCAKKGVNRIYMAGDFLQLPKVAAQTNEIDISTLELLKGKVIEDSLLRPLKHFNVSSLILANDIHEKTVQYRNTNNIYMDYLLEGTFIKHLDDLPFVSFDDACKLIRDEKYVLIASKYKILDRFKDELYPVPKIGDIVYGTDTYADVINGNLYEIIAVNGKEILAKDLENGKLSSFHYPWKFYSSSLYTFHKSQGLTFTNVIVCTDDLFEFQMLYTGITRASSSVKFFSCKPKDMRNEYLMKRSGESEIKVLRELFKDFMEHHKHPTEDPIE